LAVAAFVAFPLLATLRDCVLDDVAVEVVDLVPWAAVVIILLKGSGPLLDADVLRGTVLALVVVRCVATARPLLSISPTL
jgi:hypothetical protein